MTQTATVGRAEGAAPPPDQARGLRRREAPKEGAPLAKALLCVPRGLLYVLYLPFRGALWALDAGQLRARFRSIFFNQEGTFGAFPIVMIEQPFGVSAGGTLIHRDLLGHGEQLRLTAAFGGRLQSGVDLSFDTGRLISDADRLRVRFTYDGQPNLRFYGLGNTGQLSGAGEIDALINPYADGVAVETASFRDRIVLDVTPIRVFSDEIEIESVFAWTWQDVSNRDLDDTPVNTSSVYDTETITYFDDPFSTLIWELRLIYDSLRTPRRDLPPSTRSKGARAQIFLGLNYVLARPDTPYIRGGVDLRRHFNLFAGTRTLVLRFVTEAVSAPVRDVPVLDLPSLGGPYELRGYDRNRFRDQALWLVSLDYRFPVISALRGFVFVDTGRVFRAVDDVFERPQLGFGVGLELASRKETLARVQFASSRLGGFFFSVRLGPPFAGPNRLRRR